MEKRHHIFTTAALSQSSAGDELDAAIIFEHTSYLRKLVYIAPGIRKHFTPKEPKQV